jgi:predicted DNA-binding transcriptional regulator AlpA
VSRETVEVIALVYGLAEIAAMLDVHPRTITRWEEHKKFPQRLKIGRDVVYDRVEFDQWWKDRHGKAG